MKMKGMKENNCQVKIVESQSKVLKVLLNFFLDGNIAKKKTSVKPWNRFIVHSTPGSGSPFPLRSDPDP